MSHPAQIRSAVGNPAAGRRLPGLGRDPDHTAQELHGRLGTHVGPVDVVFRRAREHHGQPDRVDTVRGQLRAQVDAVAQRLGHGLALVDHLALAHQPQERLGEIDHAHVVQNLGEEPAVQQVQDRMLDAAHVQVHRAPAADRLDLERAAGVVRRAVPQEIPRRVHERVHRVGVAPGWTSALRALRVHPVGGGCQRRCPLGRQVLAPQVGQRDRQLVVRHGDFPASVAVDDGDRRTPEPLPGHQPVTQPVGDGSPAQPLPGQDRGDGLDRLRLAHAVQRS